MITLTQVLWFVVQSILRSAHSLPLAPMESMTLSYIPLFAATYFFWWEKPKDILVPSVVDLPVMSSEQKQIFESMTVNEKFDDENEKCQTTMWTIWYLTPRVFEKEADDAAIRNATDKAIMRAKEQMKKDHDFKVNTRAMGDAMSTHLETELRVDNLDIHVPKGMVVSHWNPELYRSRFIWISTCMFGVSFGALHLVSWNTVFPTFIELWLWRIAAFISMESILIFIQFEKVVVRWGGPLTMVSLISPALYFPSRLIMIADVFAAFRARQPGIYDTYEVSNS
ncbi:hypothetical protein MMC25_003558 [Agyrium rufum]|nr:hypothetical protein [Agyrium rufum]